MNKDKKEQNFLQKPVFTGGLKAMRQLIKQQMKYPKAALKNKIEGTVYVKYTINYKGEVIDAKVISSLGHGCDEEAIRLVKLFKFKVGKNRGIRVKFFKNIQIHFRLPKAKKVEQAIKKPVNKIQYNYIANSPKKPSTPSKSSGYTIKINY